MHRDADSEQSQSAWIAGQQAYWAGEPLNPHESPDWVGGYRFAQGQRINSWAWGIALGIPALVAAAALALLIFR
jgi:hypothetical protein